MSLTVLIPNWLPLSTIRITTKITGAMEPSRYHHKINLNDVFLLACHLARKIIPHERKLEFHTPYNTRLYGCMQ